MKRHKKFRPYVRRGNGRERSVSFRIALRLAFYRELGKPYYVLVQRGFPNHAIEVGPNRREVERGPILVATGRKTFNQWATDFQRYACRKFA